METINYGIMNYMFLENFARNPPKKPWSKEIKLTLKYLRKKLGGKDALKKELNRLKNIPLTPVIGKEIGIFKRRNKFNCTTIALLD